MSPLQDWEWVQSTPALGPSTSPALSTAIRPPPSPSSEPICLSDSLDDDMATNSQDSIAHALSLLSNAANGVVANPTAASCSPTTVSHFTPVPSTESPAQSLSTSVLSSAVPATPQSSSSRAETSPAPKDTVSVHRNTVTSASRAGSIATPTAKPRPPPTASPLLPPHQRPCVVKPSHSTPPTGLPKNTVNRLPNARIGGATGVPQSRVSTHASQLNPKSPQQVVRMPGSPCQSPMSPSPSSLHGQSKGQTQTTPGFITPMQATITKSSHSSSLPIIKLTHRPPAPTPPPASSTPSPTASPRPQIMTTPLQFSSKAPSFRPPFSISPAVKAPTQQVSYSFAGAQKPASPLGGANACSPIATPQTAGFQDLSPASASTNHGQRQRPVGGTSQSAKSSASRASTLGLTSPADPALLSQVQVC